jgi:hypothetical protein
LTLFDQFKDTDKDLAFPCDPSVFHFHPALAACKIPPGDRENIPKVVDLIDEFVANYVNAIYQ